MNFYNLKCRLITIQIFFLALLIIIPAKTYSQNFKVDGVVSTQSGPVQNALVSFVDNIDTTNKYSVLTDASGYYQLNIITSVELTDNVPVNFELEQNYPNPFSNSTSIPYKLNTQSDVVITIYDVLGRELKKFIIGVQPGGVHRVVWDGRNNFGERAATGIYFYRLKAGNESQVRKMIFGTGENKFTISLPKLSNSGHSEQVNEINKFMYSDNFTVIIENTDNTFPLIAPKQFDNVIIQNDTTINYSVTEAAAVYLDSTKQIISGFGAANILPWRPDMTTDEINKAFGTGDGQIGFSILRLRIPPVTNEFSLNVTTAQLAYSMGATIIASPWSPPASMKTNNSTVGGRLDDSSYAAYAAHLKSFVDYMASNGVPIYAVSVQNEPDVSVTYESCDWNAAEMLRFMKDYAPMVGTKVFAPESFNFNKSLSNPLLNDSLATSNLAFVGGHIYGGGLEPYLLAEAKGKEFWMTEHLVLETEWTDNLATGKDMLDCLNFGMSAYIWWYIVRFYGPIYDDGSHPSTPPGAIPGEISKRGFVMSQFSRFIRPGYYRVDATENPQSQVYLSAYKNGSSVVIVAINMGSQSVDQTFAIVNGTVSSVTPYVTSDSKDVVQEGDIPVLNGIFTTTLEGSSITTFVSE